MAIPNLPLTAFDPRYKELLLRGSHEVIDIPCSSSREARALRHRLHTYRSRAKKHYGDAHREEWEPLYLCAGTIIEELEPPRTILRLSPRHAEFSHVLDNLDIRKEPPPESSLLEELVAKEGGGD